MSRENCGFGFLQNNKLLISCVALSLGDILVTGQPHPGGGRKATGQMNSPDDTNND